MFSDDIQQRIRQLSRAEVDLGLERTRELLDALDAPDDRLNCIHIAGTNGKGSVSAYLTSILTEAGYKVGTYNSPSVGRYNERWLISGKPASDHLLDLYFRFVEEGIEAENKMRESFSLAPLHPTAFELETLIAFSMFAWEECDVCVIETGLGGRYDATNAMREKLLAVITPIGLDHTDVLGNTLSEIAAEKAAIIDGDAVTCPQSEEIMRELRRPYRYEDGEKNLMPCRLKVCGEAKLISSDLLGQRFEYEGEEYEIRMLGEHQLTNASIAICAAEELAKRRLPLTREDIKRGLEKAVWHWRFEVFQNAQPDLYVDIPEGKTLVFDGAHNPHGADALATCLKRYFPNGVWAVMGMLKDKDVEGVVQRLAPCLLGATAITPNSPRALDKKQLADVLEAHGVKCELANDVKEGINRAFVRSDRVLVAGSLTLFEGLRRK